MTVAIEYGVPTAFELVQYDVSARVAQALAEASISVSCASVARFGDVLRITFNGEPSAEDVTAIKAIVDVCGLELLRRTRCYEIDARTAALISGGYAFAGAVLSLSLAAQATLLGFRMLCDTGALAFPVVLSTIDNEATVSIANADMLYSLFETAVITYRGYRDSGVALKLQVGSGATLEAINAVVDSR